MWSYWFGMNFVWWIFWAVVIFALFAFLTPRSRRGAHTPTDPLDILKRRYAAGEITTAEFDERRARIERAGPATAPEAPRLPTRGPPPTHSDAEQRAQH